jgi:hypothetical protein
VRRKLYLPLLLTLQAVKVFLPKFNVIMKFDLTALLMATRRVSLMAVQHCR